MTIESRDLIEKVLSKQLDYVSRRALDNPDMPYWQHQYQVVKTAYNEIMAETYQLKKE